ncbi:MAG: DUF3147 domain-containing protein [Spirochaetes bacterium]|nr:DUF3147 domain-containing protein [Spirochaetota bacterium]
MPEAAKMILYFFIGGGIVMLSVFFGSKGNGFLAAFITQFPSMTVLTFILIYQSGGNGAVQKYVEGFLYTLPPWILYVVIVYFFINRLGPITSISLGIGAYMAASLCLSRVALLAR